MKTSTCSDHHCISRSTLALYLHDHYLSTEDSDFVHLVTADIDHFIKNAAIDRVLLFPPVDSYYRLLIHTTVQEFPSVCSFSVGEGDGRRTVVCLENSVLRAIQMDRWGQRQIPESVEKVQKKVSMDQDHWGHSSWFDEDPAPASQRKSASRGQQRQSGRNSQRWGHDDREVTSPEDGQVTDKSPASRDNRGAARGLGSSRRRPDVQVYVPRAKRVHNDLETENMEPEPVEDARNDEMSQNTEVITEESRDRTPSAESTKQSRPRKPKQPMEPYVPRHKRVEESTPTNQSDAAACNNQSDTRSKRSEDESSRERRKSHKSKKKRESRDGSEKKMEESPNQERGEERTGKDRRHRQRGKNRKSLGEQREEVEWVEQPTGGGNSGDQFVEQPTELDNGAEQLMEQPSERESGEEHWVENPAEGVCESEQLMEKPSEDSVQNVTRTEQPSGEDVSAAEPQSVDVESTQSQIESNSVPSENVSQELQTGDHSSGVLDVQGPSHDSPTNDVTISSLPCASSDNVEADMEYGPPLPESSDKPTSDPSQVSETDQGILEKEPSTSNVDHSDRSEPSSVCVSSETPVCQTTTNDNCTDIDNAKELSMDIAQVSEAPQSIENSTSVLDDNSKTLSNDTQDPDAKIQVDISSSQQYREPVASVSHATENDQSGPSLQTGSGGEGSQSAGFIEEDEDSWDKMFDDTGDALDPKLLEELSCAVGEVEIQRPQFDYYDYAPKEPDLDYEAYGHLLEIYDFPSTLQTRDLIIVFKEFGDSGFDIKWVDDNHAIGIFSSNFAARSASTLKHPLVKVRPLSQATRQTKVKAKRTCEFLQPYKQRPECVASVARNMVAGALGLRSKIPREKREEEKRILRDAREKKRQASRLKKDAWDGTFGANCAMDTC